MTRVLNLLGGPGCGKSTTKSGLFFQMKLAGLRVESIDEYAKELTYEEDWETLGKQDHVTRTQERRQRRLLGKVDFVLTDSPLLLGLFYAQGERATPALYEEINRLFDRYSNVNVYINRVKPYAPYGRSQKEDEARALDARIRSFMHGRLDLEVDGDENAPDKILAFLRERYLSV